MFNKVLNFSGRKKPAEVLKTTNIKVMTHYLFIILIIFVFGGLLILAKDMIKCFYNYLKN